MRTYILSAVLILLLVISIFTIPNLSKQTTYRDSEQQGLDEQITIHFSHVVAENTPKGRTALYFKELVEEKSGGQIHVELYPNGMLYNDENEMTALQHNDVQMIAPTYSKISNDVPEWGVLDLPFLFENEKDITRVLSSEVGDTLRQALEKQGIHGLGFWQNGFKQMIAKDAPIQTLADFKSKRMRTMASNVLTMQAKLLGATPQAVSFDEVNSVISKEAIDVQENTLSNIYSKSFYKEEPYITRSNHGILGYGVLMNQRFWDSLSTESKGIITLSMQEASAWNEKIARKMNVDDEQRMKAYGTHFYTLSTHEKARWKRTLQPLYHEFQQKDYRDILDAIERQLHQKTPTSSQ